MIVFRERWYNRKHTVRMGVVQSEGGFVLLLRHACGVQVHGDDSSAHHISWTRGREHERIHALFGAVFESDLDGICVAVLIKRRQCVVAVSGGDDVCAGFVQG